MTLAAPAAKATSTETACSIEAEKNLPVIQGLRITKTTVNLARAGDPETGKGAIWLVLVQTEVAERETNFLFGCASDQAGTRVRLVGAT